MNSPDASLRRIVFRVALMTIPIVAITLVAPWALRRLQASRIPTVDRLAALQRGGAPPVEPGGAEPPPKPPEHPTPEQLEKARDAGDALHRSEKGWESVTLIAPRDARRGEDGLETLPFQGFGVDVESDPAGARVLAGGVDLGETPLVASVRCTAGSDVIVRVEKAPLRPWERTVRCRADRLVKLRARLGGR